jgi:hypothetical protein
MKVNNMLLVDTLRQLMGGPSYNDTARLALEGKTKKATSVLLSLLSLLLSGI